MTYSKFPLLKKKKSEKTTLEKHISEYDTDSFTKPYIPGSGLKYLFNSFSSSPGQIELKDLIKRIKFARNGDRPIFFSLRSKIITNGLSPLIIDLMERGWISAISIDEELLINDFELSLSGKFIDYKSNSLKNIKEQGVAEETGLFLNIAFKDGEKKEKGAGESVGEYLSGSQFRFNKYSILANGYKLNIPITIHSVPGNSRLHYHSNFDGKIFGSLLEKDFILYSSIISQLGKKGVYIATDIEKNGIDIFINSLGFCSQNGKELKDITVGILGDIDDMSVKDDIETLGTNDAFSILHVKGDTGLILPLITSLLLEEV